MARLCNFHQALRNFNKMMLQICFYLQILLSQINLSATCEGSKYNFISIDIYSNTDVEIVDLNSNYLKQAFFCSTYSVWAKIQGASYIWLSQNPQSAATEYFSSRFHIIGEPSDGSIQVACDDFVDVFVNGIKADCSGAGFTSSKS